MFIFLIGQQAIANDNVVIGFHIPATENEVHKKEVEKKDIFSKSFAIENFLLKISAQSSLTRTVERPFLDGFFLSYFRDSLKHIAGHVNELPRLKFVPHALIIIYPHHYFW